ncbi:MAG: hypothetical protein NT116_05085 [Candidatus Parcubacteria bacterium]|nr:hypothetical protein [Candidatus Parcubacteria bacterium]
MRKLPRYGDADYCSYCGSLNCSWYCYNGLPEPGSESHETAVDNQPPAKLGFFSTVIASIMMVLFLGTLLGPLLVLPTILVFLFQ